MPERVPPVATPSAKSTRAGAVLAAFTETSQPGRPLEPAVREEFNERFGFDFRTVRIHDERPAADRASAIGARAFTLGRHIVFAPGEYDHVSGRGRNLLAHELSHTIQQWHANVDDMVTALRPRSSGIELAADRWAHDALSGARPAAVPGTTLTLARADRLHSDDELGAVRMAFYSKNDHLSQDQLFKIAGAVVKVTYMAKTYELAYTFFDYYSGGFISIGGHKIKLMDKAQEEAARKHDRVAETDPGGDTLLRPDVLGYDSEKLGALLLHELSHTGHAASVMGTGDYQEGHAYAVEYFYAERAGAKERMEKIEKVMTAGTVVVASERAALKQLFKVTYATLTALRELSRTGASTKLPTLNPALTSDEGDLLLSRYVGHLNEPGNRLQAIIDHIRNNLATVYTGPAL